MRSNLLAAGTLAALGALPAHAVEFTFDQSWTFAHTAANGTQSFGSEIVAFDAVNGRLWVVGTDANEANLGFGGIDILDLAGNRVHSIDTSALGGINSVAVANGKAAVALTAPSKTDPGLVRFYDAASYAVLGDVTVGANPDAVTFTPGGGKLLVANEGEPSTYLVPGNDPEGSVTIIDVGTLAPSTAAFTSFNAQAAALEAAGVRLTGPNATLAQDVEPEYIAVSASGTTAFATLQEANAIAVVDIASATVTDIVPLGLKDHSLPGNGLDASDRDGPGSNPAIGNIQNWNVFGMYMPDGIASFVNDGEQFYVIANEGDSREDWPGGAEEVRVGALTVDPALDAALDTAHDTDWQTNNDKLNRLTATSASGDTDGDGDIDRIEVFGARSFSILDDQGNLEYDSGDQIEQILWLNYPSLWADGRSDNKGPEPESAVVGTVAGRQLLFLGLERSNAVMVWDLTDFNQISFVDMLFTSGDVGPEGLSFFSHAGASYLAVANEVSETTTLYSVQPAPVPVPAAAWLLGSGLIPLVAPRLRQMRLGRRARASRQ